MADGDALFYCRDVESAQTDRLIGQIVDGRFRLDRLIGAGGMGKVYASVQLSVGREVAVKVLRADLSEIRTLQQRFFREAQLIASLRHPNIVGLVDFGRDDDIGSLYIAMEYVHGRALTDVLAAGALPLGTSLSICRQVCSGLAEAHAAGIIHRDLKPDNIMLQVTAEGALTAKLLDFGIALPRGEDETRFTATGAILGTPHYMSPEQATDKPISVQSDLYALGVILYEMIAGQVPFSGDTPLAVLFKTVNEEHTPISDVDTAELPPGPVADLLDQLLAKAPSERPESAAHVGRTLDELLASAPTPPISTVAALEALTRHVDEPTPEPAGLAVPSTAHDRDPQPMEVQAGASLAPIIALLVFMLGAVVLVAIVAGALILANLQPEPEEPLLVAMAEPILPDAASAPEAPEPSILHPVEPEPQAAEPPKERRKPAVERRKRFKKLKKRNPKKAKTKFKRAKQRKTDKEHTACQNRACHAKMTTREASYVCQHATCVVDCTAGGCRQTCQAESKCTFDCSGGGCTQACFAGTTCILSCSGGGCSESSFPGADVTHAD